jgi:hypothetical protein
MLTPSELKAVLDWAYAHPDSKAARAEADAKFLPDVSKYDDEVYVHLYVKFPRGGSYESHEITSTCEFKLLGNDNPEIYLGEVNGKHSEVSMHWKELLYESETGPYQIARLDEIHKLVNEDRADEILEEYLEKLTKYAEDSFQEYRELDSYPLSAKGFYDFIVDQGDVVVELLDFHGEEAVEEVFDRLHAALCAPSKKRSGSEDEKGENDEENGSTKKKARTEVESAGTPET